MIIKDAHPDVLIREFSDKQAVELMRDSGLAVKRVVDCATHVVTWSESPNPPKAKTISTMLFRKSITFADAISELLRQGCIDACPPLLRAQLESLLGLVYLNVKDSANRANAYQVTQIRDELRFANRLVASPPAEARSSSDAGAGGAGHDGEQLMEKAKLLAEQSTQDLSSEDLASTDKEWQRTKKACNRRPNWYSLYGGPRDLRKLAEETKMIAHYDKTYQFWSQSAHSTNVLGNIIAAGNGRALIPKIRFPVQSASTATICSNMMLEAIVTMVTQYSPDRGLDLNAWYHKQMRKGYMRLAQTEVCLDTDPRLTGDNPSN